MVKSDWEGPWVIADYAFEIVKRGLPNGEKVFNVISEYDDYLAYIRKKVNYEPGDTLALIAPFIIAFNLDSNFLIQIAKESANFIHGSIDAIKLLEKLGVSIKVLSTSYCQYVHYTTALAGIPRANVKCTLFDIDRYIDKKLKRLPIIRS
jgi:predicted HAD superfamily phosphohydrolase